MALKMETLLNTVIVGNGDVQLLSVLVLWSVTLTVGEMHSTAVRHFLCVAGRDELYRDQSLSYLAVDLLHFATR